MSGSKVQHVDKLLELAGEDDLTRFSAAEFEQAFGAGAGKRAEEVQAIVEFWPRASIDLWLYARGDWHALFEPARWGLKGEISLSEAQSFAVEMVKDRRRWPTTDEWRVRFGKEHGHKKPPLPGQEALL